jgi:hypothetical protein
VIQRSVSAGEQTGNHLLDAALEYATAGLPVFPCIPRTKLPATKNGFYDATTNPETIKRYWRIADRNIAIPTGAASGFWVLDIDGLTGEASLRELERKHGPLPSTREVITVRDGRHVWFKDTGPIPSSAGKIAAGIDIRGAAGYIMAPPSVWENGRTYVWSVDSIDELAIAPDWLVQLARKKPTISEQALTKIKPRLVVVNSSSNYGRRALDDEIAALATTPPGSRNHALNKAGFALFQLVAGGELSEQEVLARLIEAANANGLMSDPDDGPRKVAKTIESARRAGMQSPRSRSGAT